MKSLRWLVAPIVGAAGIILLLSQSAIGDVVVEDYTAWSKVTAVSERTALAGLVSQFWNGPLDRVKRVCFVRRGSQIEAEVTGVRRLNEDDAWARLQQGESVRGNRWAEESTAPVVLSSAQRTALAGLVAGMWNGDVSLLTQACWRARLMTDKMGQSRIVQGKVWGAKSLTRADAVAAWAAGREIRPLAVVE